MNIISPLKPNYEARSSESEPPRSSVLKILEGALIAIGRNGSRRLSMSDICSASGVSRGTLYRYFSTKDDVLAAVSEFVSTNFENGVRSAADQHLDPIERFRAVIRFFADFTVERTPDRIFEVEPGFHLDFFRSHFARHKLAVREALNVTLNFIEQRLSTTIDRDGFAETLIRLQLSTMIVPAGTQWNALWEASPDTLERFILMTVGQPLVASPYS
jgi:AcrR family transcriptional regulator